MREPRLPCGLGLIVFRLQSAVLRRQQLCPFRIFHRAWIRTVRQNQPIIWGDVYDPALAWQAIADLFKPRSRLEAENLFLRHQSNMIIAVDVFSAMVTPM